MTADELARRLSGAYQPYSLADLVRAISDQTATIEGLERQLSKTNSIRSKLHDYIVGGAIGAILGFFLSLVIG